MSTMDLTNCFWQIPISLESRKYFTTATPKGLFRYTRMPMGARNSSAHCQHVVEAMLRKLPEVTTDPFQDDLVVTSESFYGHLSDLRKVFTLLREHNFFLKRKKCHFFKPEVKFLGHYISEEGIKPCTEKVDVVLAMDYPVNTTQIKSFVSACRWFGK